jgi:transcriptional regulator GlxA family with amidase domain
MGRFKWFCIAHNVGFNHAMHVARHYKAEMRKSGRSIHQTVEDMLVTKSDASQVRVATNTES